MPSTRPTFRRPQTIAQAKKEFKKYGPRLSSQEQRRLDRGIELDRRAEKIRESEKRRRENARRKHEKDQREREARRRMNIASQKPYASPHQTLLEKFVCLDKAEIKSQGRDGKDCENPVEERESTSAPWIEGDIDDGILLDLVSLDEPLRNSEVETSFVTSRSMIRLQDPTPIDGEVNTSNIDEAHNTIGIWDDILVSNTQIERDMSDAPLQEAITEVMPIDPFLALLSTQDVNISFNNLDEAEHAPATLHEPTCSEKIPDLSKLLQKRAHDSILMPPPRLPTLKIAIPQDILALDLFSVDFNLSTQDCREIG